MKRLSTTQQLALERLKRNPSGLLAGRSFDNGGVPNSVINALLKRGFVRIIGNVVARVEITEAGLAHLQECTDKGTT